jgi:hypothetical protein
MTTTRERQSPPTHREARRIDAQDDSWTVSVAENPHRLHRPSSYTLYVKSECPFTPVKSFPKLLFVALLRPVVVSHLPFHLRWYCILSLSPISFLGAALPLPTQLEFQWLTELTAPLPFQPPHTTLRLAAPRASSSSSITSSMTRIRLSLGRHCLSTLLRYHSPQSASPSF